ncbi:RadC family protein [Candidatus Odyssella thessalonicensis]|uniref:RadC family protein n=1 Tax=Candidatus Odyssella thessalonicensis TaxID=84647 RepID=UPI000225BF86|nr:DNA repair protein RadC [Candidatus Odyssella thessalonicensis]
MKSLPSPETKAKPHYQGHRQRLKDRFASAGAAAFADYELLELFLFQIVPRTDTKPLAKALLEKFGCLSAIFGAPDHLLKDVKGVGDSVIHAFKLHHALYSRALQKEIHGKCVLQSWQQVIDYCGFTMSDEMREQLRVLYLDQKNQIICDEIQQTGTVNHTPIYPREVMKRGFEVGASALILVHNHPSGDPTPSRDDIDLTLKIQRIGTDLGIKLHDHIIIGKGKHCSFKALGII